MALTQQVNAGGILAPEDVIGRDDFIQSSWRTLEAKGLYITGERRMGKSSVVRDKMGNEPIAGYKLVYLDVSDADTPFAFVDSLFREAKKLSGTGVKLKLGAIEVFRRLVPGLEFLQMIKLPESLAPHWKEMLRAVLTDFANSDTRLILAFDEMPLMLDKIKRGMGEAVAMDILDTLRKERQSDKRLRMIYTGSLGLHHVLTNLQNAGYQNSPLNDMKQVELGPLDESHATELARRLLKGMAVHCDPPESVAQHIAQITNGMPFYIQNLVDDLADSGETCTVDVADRFLNRRLTDMNDPWDLGYYKSRIDTHYQTPNAQIAVVFLDQLAHSETPLSFDELFDALSPKKVTAEEEVARRTMELLGRDHYISQTETGAFQFRYPIIARSWRYRRPLSARKGNTR